MGIYGVEELCHGLAANQSGLKVLADRAPVNTDRFNRFAMQDSNSARPLLTIELLDGLLRPHDPLVEPDSELFNGSALLLMQRVWHQRWYRMETIPVHSVWLSHI
ncbi:MAG: hypothetical protein R3C02_15435 [Planctomycetaceae bacterium]